MGILPLLLSSVQTLRQSSDAFQDEFDEDALDTVEASVVAVDGVEGSVVVVVVVVVSVGVVE